MCGIVGEARTDERPVDRVLIEHMCAALEHRGPDSRGVHIGDGVGLGELELPCNGLAQAANSTESVAA